MPKTDVPSELIVEHDPALTSGQLGSVALECRNNNVERLSKISSQKKNLIVNRLRKILLQPASSLI